MRGRGNDSAARRSTRDPRTRTHAPRRPRKARTSARTRRHVLTHTRVRCARAPLTAAPLTYTQRTGQRRQMVNGRRARSAASRDRVNGFRLERGERRTAWDGSRVCRACRALALGERLQMAAGVYGTATAAATLRAWARTCV